MREELDKFLCERYPLLYADRHASMQETCMYWGFDVGDGWFGAIDRLSAELEKIIAAMPGDDRPRAAQVKEKFGGLRFYMTWETDEMSDLISDAEEECWRTCEVCGAAGQLQTTGGWLKTLCSSEECDPTDRYRPVSMENQND